MTWEGNYDINYEPNSKWYTGLPIHRVYAQDEKSMKIVLSRWWLLLHHTYRARGSLLSLWRWFGFRWSLFVLDDISFHHPLSKTLREKTFLNFLGIVVPGSLPTWFLISLIPRTPLFFVLQFVFSIIHGSKRAYTFVHYTECKLNNKNWGGLRMRLLCSTRFSAGSRVAAGNNATILSTKPSFFLPPMTACRGVKDTVVFSSSPPLSLIPRRSAVTFRKQPLMRSPVLADTK